MAIPAARLDQTGVLDGLNDAQIEAVEATRGPVCILAGAGSGKTTTITRRIAHQVLTEDFGPHEILALAFTTKAAREMAGRLDRLGARGVRVNTFHAEALAQFRRFCAEQPDILSHKGQLLHRIARMLPPPHRFTALRDLATEIEWAKNRSVGARDYLDAIQKDGHEPPIPAELMHRVFVTYEKRRRAANLIDFEDLLARTADILEDDARALGAVRSRYAAFTVDEYQDTNPLQQRLLDLWTGARDDACVVGDDYQSIFGFTGASAAYLLRFPERYDHCLVVRLVENYRSSPEILAVANRLVPRLGGSRKSLEPTRPSGPPPRLREFERAADEVTWIVEECRRLHDSEHVPYEEIAILVRINARTEPFEEALARAGIPYQVRDGAFLSRPAARAFLARARRTVGPVPEAAAVIARALGWSRADDADHDEEATRQADLGRLVVLASEFAGTMEEFCADLRARFAAETESSGVQLLTYHRAKGLEFEAVFLPRLEDKELPFALARAPEDVAEERRLFYVGITRAKRFLAISHARAREGERRSRPKRSPFLEEITPTTARAATTARPTPVPRKTPTDDPTLRALKEWRLRIARETGVPAYVVFHDSTLEEIAARKPATPAELRAIAGVGPTKTQRYAEAILSIVA